LFFPWLLIVSDLELIIIKISLFLCPREDLDFYSGIATRNQASNGNSCCRHQHAHLTNSFLRCQTSMAIEKEDHPTRQHLKCCRTQNRAISWRTSRDYERSAESVSIAAKKATHRKANSTSAADCQFIGCRTANLATIARMEQNENKAVTKFSQSNY